MLTFVVFVLVLGLLIFIHELGHFVTARRNGIQAEEFGFGFPPRALGAYFDEQRKKWRFVAGGKEVKTKNTVYSLNWLPIGGFVKIKGEDGSNKREQDSFASKSALTRTKVLLAGVGMNLVFAWLLLAWSMGLGVMQSVDDPSATDSQILISAVNSSSPAKEMDLKMGDVVLRKQVAYDGRSFQLVTAKDLQDFIALHRDQQLKLEVSRGSQRLTLVGEPQPNEEGRAVIGIALAQVVKAKYGFWQSLWQGFLEMKTVFVLTMDMLGKLLIGKGQGSDVTGVVGIAMMTGDVLNTGFVNFVRFVAMLSLNLGIINALPFPALDGGRVLFILIEKLKGSPVSQKVENAFHTTGFALLIGLMLFVTYRDFVNFDIVGKVLNLF